MKALSGKVVVIFGVIVYFFVLIVTFASILSGSMAFWYDPARDLLLATGNLEKPTLIGPPAGIPGIFYGPYWIWMLSIGMLVSKDPRIITIIVLFLPYFIILPLLLWKFARKWGSTTAVILGTLFLLNFNTYAKQLWNPHPAPLLFLITAYLLAIANFISNKRKDIAVVLLAGFSAGILVNLHISFGIGLIGGLLLFFIFDCLQTIHRTKTKKAKVALRYFLSVILFGIGALVAFAPFLLFEARHGFNQLHAAFNAMLSEHAVVGMKGLEDIQIMSEFLKSFYRLTGFTPVLLGILVFVCVLNILFAIYNKKKINMSAFDIRIFSLAIASFIALFTVYMTSKNPVWNYHFIGVEVVFLLLIGVVASKLSFVRYFLLIWVVFLFLTSIPAAIRELQRHTHIDGTLAAKEAVVEEIVLDSQDDAYGVVAYNPAIYTYDYDYLFLWKENKKLSKNVAAVDLGTPVYVIIPSENSPRVQDYLNAQTRNLRFNKLKDWKVGYTRVIKVQVEND